MNTLAEKLADAWIKKDLIQLKSDELPKNREDSHHEHDFCSCDITRDKTKA